MATLSFEIGRGRKDGTHSIVIRVNHAGVIRRIPTSLVARPDDLTKDGRRIRSRALKEKIDDLLREMYKAVEAISYFDLQTCNVDYVKNRILDYHSRNHFKLDFFAFAKEFSSAITVPATRQTYEVAANALGKYMAATFGVEVLDVNAITVELLRGFVSFVDNAPKEYYRKAAGKVEKTTHKKKKGTAAKAYLSKLGSIFSAAKEKYNDEDAGVIRIPRSPFAKVKVKASPSDGQKPLPLATMRALVTAEAKDEYERASLDTFIVSFGLMGANLVDMYKAAPPATEWKYRRTKTEHRREDHAEMHVGVPDCLRPFLQRLTLHARKDRWLNLSWRYSSVNSATKTINDLLKRWAERNGLAPFTLYAARKSWATIARSKACGIDKAVVDECLAHVGDFRLTDIYAVRDWEVMRAANEKVCNLVFASENKINL